MKNSDMGKYLTPFLAISSGGNFPFQIGIFPDGMVNVVRDTAIPIEHQLTLTPQNSNDLVGLFIALEMCLAEGKFLPAYMPYCPFGRADKGWRFEQWFLSNLRTKVASLEILEPHSHFITETMRAKAIGLEDYAVEIMEYIIPFGSSVLVIAPDKGAKDRANRVAGELKSKYESAYPTIYATKLRNPETNELSSPQLEETYGISAATHILVVDDISDAGGTFKQLAPCIREQFPINPLHLLVGSVIQDSTFDYLTEYDTISCVYRFSTREQYTHRKGN